MHPLRPTALKAFAFSLTLLAGAHVHATDADLDAALGALERLDYDGAAKILNHLAESGNPQARAALATLIESGHVASDVAQTPMELLREAADEGVTEAALELGNREFLGEHAGRDVAAAIRWWKRAAELGSARAAYNLGVTYLEGNGVAPDAAAALTWLEQAAQADLAAAWFALGVARLRGGADSADGPAACSDMERAARLGDVRAQFNLGVMYERGISCAADAAAALEWYRRSDTAGATSAAAAIERLGAPDPAHATIHDGEWVRTHDPARYTLQVAAGANEQAILAVLARYDPAVDRARILLPSTPGPRFVALVGSFTSYLEALEYLNGLPPALVETKPWIRRFGVLQQLSNE